MTLKSDAKFEEKLICCVKNDKNLVNFDLSTWNSQNLHFEWFLLCKVYNVSPEFEKKTNLWLGKWHEEFATFLQEYSKVSKLGGILLSKVENIWPLNLQRSYVSWQWRMMQNLKGNWLIVSKLTWAIWRILTRAPKSFKNLHFKYLQEFKVAYQ